MDPEILSEIEIRSAKRAHQPPEWQVGNVLHRSQREDRLWSAQERSKVVRLIHLSSLILWVPKAKTKRMASEIARVAEVSRKSPARASAGDKRVSKAVRHCSS